VELHALHGELAVAHAHDLAVLGLCGNLEALGQVRAPDRQRMRKRVATKRLGNPRNTPRPE